MNNDISVESHGTQWKRTFYPIWLGQAFSLVSSAAVQFTLIWWLTIETKSAIILSLASLAGFFPQAILGPFIGTLVDRHSRKAIMITADLSIAFATLILGAVFAFGSVDVWMIFVLLLIRSLGSSFHTIAFQSSVPLFVPEDQLMRVSGLNQTIFSAANIAGPVLAGFMMTAMSMQYIMLVDVAGACIATLTLAYVSIPQPASGKNENDKSGMINEIKFGFRELSKSKGLMMVSVIIGMVTLVIVPVGALFPLMVNGYFKGNAAQASIVEAAFGAGMLAGSILLTVWSGFKKKVHTINTGIILLGVALVASGLLPEEGYIGFVIFSLLMGLSGPLFGGPFTVLFQTLIEPSVMGRVLSIVHSMMLILTPIGLFIAAPVSEIMGIPFWFFISGSLIVITGISGFFIKSISNMENIK